MESKLEEPYKEYARKIPLLKESFEESAKEGGVEKKIEALVDDIDPIYLNTQDVLWAQTYLDAPDYWGQTPLHRYLLAKPTPNIGVIKLMKRNVNTQDDEKNTPLCIYFSRTQTVDLNVIKLLQEGLDVQNNGLDTPLHSYLKRFKIRKIEVIVIKLLSAYLNIQNNEGNTPLHEYLSENTTPDIEVIKVLIGDNLNIQNNEGYTPLHLYLKYSETSYIDNTDLRVYLGYNKITPNIEIVKLLVTDNPIQHLSRILNDKKVRKKIPPDFLLLSLLEKWLPPEDCYLKTDHRPAGKFLNLLKTTQAGAAREALLVSLQEKIELKFMSFYKNPAPLLLNLSLSHKKGIEILLLINARVQKKTSFFGLSKPLLMRIITEAIKEDLGAGGLANLLGIKHFESTLDSFMQSESENKSKREFESTDSFPINAMKI